MICLILLIYTTIISPFNQNIFIKLSYVLALIQALTVRKFGKGKLLYPLQK